tara:strand:- start:5590 stop:6627 length:1038 start_codon:yes stop_codon:yes gene_type:complete
MAVYVNNITLNTGQNFYRDFYLDNADGTSLDLTGYTGASQVRKHPSSLNAAASFTVTFVDRTQGHIRVSLTRNQSQDIKPGRYMYDVMLTDNSGVRSIVVEGMVNCSQDISPFEDAFVFTGQDTYSGNTLLYAGIETDSQQVRSSYGFKEFDETFDGIDSYGVVCMGAFTTCSGSVDDLDALLTTDNIAKIDAYLAKGGVVWFRGEYGGCLSHTDENNVLTKLGTSIRVNNDVYYDGPFGGGAGVATLAYTSGLFPSEGVPLYGFQTVTGGTPVYNDWNGRTVFAYERKGNGIIFVGGDSLGFISESSVPAGTLILPGNDGDYGDFWVKPTAELYTALRDLVVNG